MTSSGTYNFDMSVGSTIIEAFDRLEVRPAEITREQMSSAVRSLNLELASLSNNPVLLWCVDLLTIPLIQGQATYVLDKKYQLVTDVYCGLIQSSQPQVNRIMDPISRSEYASYSVPSAQGAPSQYWFQRDITPSLTIYLTPDGVSETNMYAYAMRRIQDANASDSSIDIPYRFLDAIAGRLAARLAVKYRKDLLPVLEQLADKALEAAMLEDRERASLMISCDFGIFDPLR